MGGSAKFKIEKFDGKGDFGMWRKKMRAILVQQKVAKALGGEQKMPSTMTDEENKICKSWHTVQSFCTWLILF